MVGKAGGTKQSALLPRASQRDRRKPDVEQRQCLDMDMRRKGAGRLVLHDRQGTRVLRARGFMGTRLCTGLARMRSDIANAERCGQEQRPYGNYEGKESCHY
jgi:hypothetical protein